ncbi:hypothetical protein OsI_12682 [Oryza sativa Indica Group]|uniref:Uncharacterized protein n=1 Tax=Oryza sativa subsp. indica TaxID=39946 RepID=A2XJR2_ORYSI|nr:hypothetical protein OsI_12682 [Oryza sativa Indica Group]
MASDRRYYYFEEDDGDGEEEVEWLAMEADEDDVGLLEEDDLHLRLPDDRPADCWNKKDGTNKKSSVKLQARILQPDPEDGFKMLVKHRQPVTAVVLSKDSDKGFSASKDGVIVHWDVETGKSEKYLWPSENVLVSHHANHLYQLRSKQY